MKKDTEALITVRKDNDLAFNPISEINTNALYIMGIKE
jgi:hypothetical protein